MFFVFTRSRYRQVKKEEYSKRKNDPRVKFMNSLKKLSNVDFNFFGMNGVQPIWANLTRISKIVTWVFVKENLF